ncbi:MAG: VWA domain-containing protein [Pseudomonadales bacterium]|nr:VWA domain-containing protein [Pseudomonadales bacterium]
MARARSQRDFNPISLAFLDVMSSGFGAVVLIFLILDHSISVNSPNNDPALAAEINLLNEEILEGQRNLVRIRNTVSDVDFQMVQAQGLATSIQEEINTFLEELAQLENESSTSQESVEKLKSDIAVLEAEAARLRAAEEQQTGNNIRQFIGNGNRQYLTGLYLGGNRILILVDTSASMLDNTIVNIIRRRNMPKETKLNSEKWVNVRNTVDWLTTQLPPPSQYQIYTFNKAFESLIPGTEGQWLEVADEKQINQAVENLHQVVPSEGTNLQNIFQAIQKLSPLPDNIFLITDGLPTLDNNPPRARTISGPDRERLFERAIRELPSGIPVNIIMEPLEGDPMASPLYWQLAIATKGAYMSPSADWP